jgi:hypothetical protein
MQHRATHMKTRTFYCCRRHKFSLRALLCNTHYFYTADSDVTLSNTDRMHCSPPPPTAKMVMRTLHRVKLHVHIFSLPSADFMYFSHLSACVRPIISSSLHAFLKFKIIHSNRPTQFYSLNRFAWLLDYRKSKCSEWCVVLNMKLQRQFMFLHSNLM